MGSRIRTALLALPLVCAPEGALAQGSGEPPPPATYPAPATPPAAQPNQGGAPPPPAQQAPGAAPAQQPAQPAPQAGYGAPPPPPQAPPPYGAAPPGYGWQQAPPAVMPYSEGDPTPPGYHVEHRLRMGPLITGIALGGVGYMAAVAVASGDDFDNQKGWLMVPVLGPWLTLALRDECEYDVSSSTISASEFSDCAVNASSLPQTLLVLDGLLQGTGALLVIIGVALPRMVLVRNDTVALEVAPVRVGGGEGLGIVGTF